MVQGLRKRFRNPTFKRKSRKPLFSSKQIRFFQQLSSFDPETTSQTALQSLHFFIKNNTIKNYDRFQKKTQALLKICKVCDKFDRLRSIKTCITCEDHYHKSCYGKDMTFTNEGFKCYQCKEGKIPLKKCKVCNKKMSQNGNKVTCEFCQNECHLNCMKADENLCKKCQRVRFSLKIDKRSKKIKKKERQQEIKSKNINLRDMFQKIRKQKNQKQMIVENEQILNDRKYCLFKAINLLDDNPNEIEKYKKKLLKIIEAKQMKYTEDLRNIEFHIQTLKQKSMNLGLRNMSQKQEIEYLKYKNQPIGPFIFQYSKNKGYGVIANMDIPKGSIICQYVGQVNTLRECTLLDIKEKSDSEMDLWNGKNSDSKLLIRPKEWTNIARFINGVRNSKQPTNLNSIRLCYRGIPCVILYANRKIMKGQNLNYDYNAGRIGAQFDTSGFVD